MVDSVDATILSESFTILQRTKHLPVLCSSTNPESAICSYLTFPHNATNASNASSVQWMARDLTLSVRATSESVDRRIGLHKNLRRLAAECVDVYFRLRVSGECNQNTSTTSLHHKQLSRAYCQAIARCIDAYESRDALLYEDPEEDFIDYLKVTLALWHLCEIIFLRNVSIPRDDPIIAYQVAHWLQEHYIAGKKQKLARKSLHYLKSHEFGGIPVENDPEYWKTVVGFVLLGQGHHAWQILAHHSSYHAAKMRKIALSSDTGIQHTFGSIQRLLISIPVSTFQQDSSDDNNYGWNAWHNACLELYHTDSWIQNDENLSTVLRIMMGDTEILQLHAETWYELMLARLCFEEPKHIANRLEFLMANSIDKFQHQMTPFDYIIVAILQSDVKTALKGIGALGIHFFSAHLTDLLTEANVISNQNLGDPVDASLREYYVVNYAMELNIVQGMWQLAARYFGTCVRYGACAIQSIIHFESVDSERKVQQLMLLIGDPSTDAHTEKIQNQWRKALSQRRAQTCFKSKKYGCALYWMLTSEQYDAVDTYCEKFLDECENANCMTPLLDALEFLRPQTKFRKTRKLEWLIEYRDFYLVLQDIDALSRQMQDAPHTAANLNATLKVVLARAAAQVHKLLNSTSDVKRLRVPLLTNVENLLDAGQLTFTSQQLFAVMKYLNELEWAFVGTEKGNVQELSNKIRSLLPIQLTNAIIFETKSRAIA